MKALLVDDSVTMRRIQKTQLEAMGIAQIDEASDGQDALNKLEAGAEYDLMLLDVNMPNMDGMTLLKILRGNPKYKAMKIFMCTSESEKAKVVEAISAGANNYIVKPFTPELLREKLMI